MIDLVNSSPNMDTFCHCERNLEFRRGNLNLDQLPKLIFHAFYWPKLCLPPCLLYNIDGGPRIMVVETFGILSSFAISRRVVEARLQDKGSPLRPS